MVAEFGKEPEKLLADAGDKETAAITKESRKEGDEGKIEKEGKKKKTETRSHFNGPTLNAIQQYIKSGNCFSDTLDDEEVSTFNSKIHRYTVERTRGRQGILFRDDSIQNGDDPNVEINPIILTKEDIAQERMYNNIYQKEEFYAVATKFLKNVLDGAQDTGGPDLVFHNKAARWLKRAAGMERKYDPYERDDDQQKPTYSEDSDDIDGEAISGGGDDRRITRRRIQMTRKKRRLERMGQDTESFRILTEVALDISKDKMSGKTKKNRKRSWSTIHNVTDDDSDLKTNDTSNDVDESTPDEAFPGLESTGLATIYSRDGDGKQQSWDRDVNEPHKMESDILPPVVARLGLEFRPRPPGLEEEKKTFHASTISDNVRVETSGKLLNALSNKHARRWAMGEFFYSDLDKEWYQNNGIASDLAKHRLPIDARTQLTRQEWSLVRQKLRPRSRVFSKRFIAEQLKQRNRHRALVRKLQQDTSMEAFAPLSAGTPVSAIDRRSHAIRTGRILLHDPKNHCYLVQFDDKDSGCEICQDFEVATIAQSNDTVRSRPSLYEPCENFTSSNIANCDAPELVLHNDINNSDVADDIERELLISSIAVATEAFERKKLLLETLENCVGSSAEGAKDDCSKLLANLDRINSTLETAQAYLQILYGKVFGSTQRDIGKVKLDSEIPESHEFQQFVSSLESISGKVGTLAFSSSEDDRKSTTESASSEILQHDLSNSTSLLLLSNYLAETSSLLNSSGIEKTSYSKAMNASLKIVYDRFSKKCLPPIQQTLLERKKLEQESRVEEELRDLSVAVGMLRAEVELATDESRGFELNNAMFE